MVCRCRGAYSEAWQTRSAALSVSVANRGSTFVAQAMDSARSSERADNEISWLQLGSLSAGLKPWNSALYHGVHPSHPPAVDESFEASVFLLSIFYRWPAATCSFEDTRQHLESFWLMAVLSYIKPCIGLAVEVLCRRLRVRTDLSPHAACIEPHASAPVPMSSRAFLIGGEAIAVQS